MSDEIRPALTPEQWAELEYERDGKGLPDEGTLILLRDAGLKALSIGDPPGFWTHGERDRYALAALALHGQPFGFTWDDVDAIRRVARMAGEHTMAEAEDVDRALSVARRIAALLPPRTMEEA